MLKWTHQGLLLYYYFNLPTIIYKYKYNNIYIKKLKFLVTFYTKNINI